MLFNKRKDNTTNLAKKMLISLFLGLIAGAIIIFIREYLNSSGNSNTWALINNIFFQDITTEEGRHSLGLFYIIGQLFINSLQLIIVPMIFSSIALAMCNICLLYTSICV